MKTQFVKAGEAVEKGETLALQLERSRRELDVCRRQLAQMKDLFDAHKRSEALLQGEKNLTEMIARGDSLEPMLEGSCRLVEEALPGSLAIILLVDGKRLRRGAAPSFPKYLAEVDGFEINPAVGTCSAAAARKEQVITADITTDPHWAGYLELAARHGLRAGWATPILSSASQVLGTFSLYWSEPRSPTPQHLQIINQIARLVAFAIERKQAAEALNASEQVARGQVEALIYSLDVLATASEPKKFLRKMLSTICRQLSGLSVALWLYNEPTESMTLQLITDSTGTFDFHENRLLTNSSLSWGKNSGYQELLFAACPVLCEDTATDPRLCGEMRDYFLMTGVKKFLAVPIVAEGRVRGMITVRHEGRPPYRTEEVELAQALAHQVMLAIRLTEVGEQSRQAAVLAERNRMARDVHDTLAQGFTGVIVQLEAAEYAISEGDRKDANRHLRQAGELARRSLSEARRSVHALRPQALEEANFWEALKGMAKSTTVGTTLQTKFEAKDKVPVIPLVWQANLLRIGQEALSNTLKYARARQFRTRLTANAKELRLELCDDGDGFQVRKRHDGVGLVGMRERAEEMGGEFKIVSSRGKGTKITVILPRGAGRQPAVQPKLARPSTGMAMEAAL
jgi:signal transduction histidine kinase